MHTKAGIQYPTDSGLTGFQLLMEYQTFQTIFLSVFLASYFAFFASLRLCGETVFVAESDIVEYGRTGCLEKSVSRVVFTDIMFVFSAFFASLR